MPHTEIIVEFLDDGIDSDFGSTDLPDDYDFSKEISYHYYIEHTWFPRVFLQHRAEPPYKGFTYVVRCFGCIKAFWIGKPEFYLRNRDVAMHKAIAYMKKEFGEHNIEKLIDGMSEERMEIALWRKKKNQSLRY